MMHECKQLRNEEEIQRKPKYLFEIKPQTNQRTNTGLKK